MSTDGELSGATRRDLVEVRKAYPKDPLGFFVEEPWTVEALYRFECDLFGTRSPIPVPVWDPACGTGNIPETLKRLGIDAWGTDLIDRRYGLMFRSFDFLSPATTHRPFKAIITNPPYGDLAEAFVLKALGLADYVAVLVQAKFVYSQGRYERLFSQHPPSRELRFVDRPSMPPGHLLGKIKAKGGKMDFSFVIWDSRTPGSTTAHWIRKPGR